VLSYPADSIYHKVLAKVGQSLNSLIKLRKDNPNGFCADKLLVKLDWRNVGNRAAKNRESGQLKNGAR
jgi:hypothetical protein